MVSLFHIIIQGLSLFVRIVVLCLSKTKFKLTVFLINTAEKTKMVFILQLKIDIQNICLKTTRLVRVQYSSPDSALPITLKT